MGEEPENEDDFIRLAKMLRRIGLDGRPNAGNDDAGVRSGRARRRRKRRVSVIERRASSQFGRETIHVPIEAAEPREAGEGRQAVTDGALRALKTSASGGHHTWVYYQHCYVSFALRVLGLGDDHPDAKARTHKRYQLIFDPNGEENGRRNLHIALLAELGRIGKLLPQSDWVIVQKAADDAVKLLKQGHTTKQVEAHLKACRMSMKAMILDESRPNPLKTAPAKENNPRHA